MGDTTISWADKVWNPVVGCSKLSPGCRSCYAESIAKRFAGHNGFSDWRPWTAPNAAHNVVLHPGRLTLPLRWRKPQRIFVNSMSDLFHEQVPDLFIGAVWGIMALASQHTFLILTKRPARAQDWFNWTSLRLPHRWWMAEALERLLPGGQWGDRLVPEQDWPLHNVWLGVSVEDQRRADERLPLLARIPAAVRFISVEPMLGPVNLEPYFVACPIHDAPGRACNHSQCKDARRVIDGVIIGGESGPDRRELDMDAARGAIRQCQDAGVKTYVKQDSGRRPGMQGRFTDGEWALKELPHVAFQT